jgi:hypothetical protein
MITVVSGLPRSGTSMMMQMLKAGGMPILSEKERGADTYNPRGYLEWVRIKELESNPGLIEEAEGKAVKVFSPFLPFLSPKHEYRVLLMQRPLAEVLKSQTEMLRQGSGSVVPTLDPTAVQEAFAWHLTNVENWREHRPNMAFLKVDYPSVVREPVVAAIDIAAFLGIELKIAAMAEQVEAKLYRVRMEAAHA